MKPTPKLRPASMSRHGFFTAVRSGARTAQIGRSAVILRKTPSIFRKSTRAPEALSEYFAKKHLRLFPNQPAVQNGWAPGWLVRRANGDAGASHQRGGAAHAGEPSAATTAHQPPARRRSTRGQAEHGHHRAPQDRAPPTDEAAERPEHTWISAARPSSTSSTDALVRG